MERIPAGDENPENVRRPVSSRLQRSLNTAVNCTEGAIQSAAQDEVRKLCSAVLVPSKQEAYDPRVGILVPL